MPSGDGLINTSVLEVAAGARLGLVAVSGVGGTAAGLGIGHRQGPVRSPARANRVGAHRAGAFFGVIGLQQQASLARPRTGSKLVMMVLEMHRLISQSGFRRPAASKTPSGPTGTRAVGGKKPKPAASGQPLLLGCGSGSAPGWFRDRRTARAAQTARGGTTILAQNRSAWKRGREGTRAAVAAIGTG